MYRWNEAVQKMINWLEDNIDSNPTLCEMSKQVGYSPYYCSSQFKKIVGVTIKTYVAGRRLSKAVCEIRDTDKKLLDIALDNGFSSQQALTRAFVYAYGCTPAAYRRNPMPITIAVKKEVLFPEYYNNMEDGIMNETKIPEVSVRIEYLPEHKFICLVDKTTDNYCDFWEKHDCDKDCGILESISNHELPNLPCHTAGWIWDDGRRGYTYGIGVPRDYSGGVPESFEVLSYPAGYYLVFDHPPFNFLTDCESTVDMVEKLAFNFDPKAMGYKWDEKIRQDYQRFNPEVIGYKLLRPVVKI